MALMVTRFFKDFQVMKYRETRRAAMNARNMETRRICLFLWASRYPYIPFFIFLSNVSISSYFHVRNFIKRLWGQMRHST